MLYTLGNTVIMTLHVKSNTSCCWHGHVCMELQQLELHSIHIHDIIACTWKSVHLTLHVRYKGMTTAPLFMTNVKVAQQ